MSWLLFYLLAALHPVAFIVIGARSKSWKTRLWLWALLPVPAVVYCWDYFAIKHEHEQMCAAEGGLKVLIQPEKVDRVRLVGDIFGLSAQGILEHYYPHVKFVEALTEERGSKGEKLHEYDAFTAEPNPKKDLPWVKGFLKERELIFPASRVKFLDPTIYEISVHESKIPHGTLKEARLSKGGKLYAKHTELVHWWTGIQYPDALPTWRCPEQKMRPPINDQNAPQEKWTYPPSAYTALRELIFK